VAKEQRAERLEIAMLDGTGERLDDGRIGGDVDLAAMPALVECGSRAVDQRLCRVRVGLEHRGDVRDRPVAHVMQDQCGALARREVLQRDDDGVSHILAQDRGALGVSRRRPGRELGGIERIAECGQSPPYGGLAQVVEARCGGDP
jgi:hypothetical protein